MDFQQLNKLRRTQGEGGDDLEYKRYLQELMANNPDFAKRFGSNTPDDIAKRFANLRGVAPNGVRSHLDENERKSVEELKELHRARMLQQAIGDGKLPPLRGQKPLGGYDPRVAMDMMRNKRVTPDGGPVNIQDRMQEFRRKQEELDKQRQNEFKKHEMQIEHLRRRKLKEMDEVQRLKEEERLRQFFEERRKHQPLVHPASREQLEDVWRKHDGFKDEDFNPKTFFNLHDMNGDGQLDIYEVEALFRRELEKVYRGRMDSAEALEDLLEMRQHVFSEVDRDQDGLLSLAEFMTYTNRDIFNVKEEWKPVIDRNTEDIFSDKEMEDYEEDYQENDDYDYDYDTYGNIIRNPKQHEQEQQQRQKVEQEQQQQQQQLHQEQQQPQQHSQEQKQVQPSFEEQLQQQEMLLKRLKEMQQNPQQGLDQQQLEDYRRKLMQMQAEMQQQQSQEPKQPDSSPETTTSDPGTQAPVKEEDKHETQQDGMWKGQVMSDPVAGNQQL